MHKMQNYIVKGKRVFVGLEDSKKTWKLAQYHRLRSLTLSEPLQICLNTYLELVAKFMCLAYIPVRQGL